MSSDKVDQIKADLLKRIEQEMESSGISQGEIARRTGILRTNINHIMRRKNSPSIELLVKIAESIGLNVELRIKRIKD